MLEHKFSLAYSKNISEVQTAITVEKQYILILILITAYTNTFRNLQTRESMKNKKILT